MDGVKKLECSQSRSSVLPVARNRKDGTSDPRRSVEDGHLGLQRRGVLRLGCEVFQAHIAEGHLKEQEHLVCVRLRLVEIEPNLWTDSELVEELNVSVRSVAQTYRPFALPDSQAGELGRTGEDLEHFAHARVLIHGDDVAHLWYQQYIRARITPSCRK